MTVTKSSCTTADTEPLILKMLASTFVCQLIFYKSSLGTERERMEKGKGELGDKKHSDCDTTDSEDEEAKVFHEQDLVIILSNKPINLLEWGEHIEENWDRLMKENTRLGDKRATNHHHRQWHQLANSQTSNSSSSGSRQAREELKKRKIIYIQFPR